MSRKWDLCQKSRHPVTKITGIRALDCDGYHPAAQQPHWTARNRDMAEDLGNGRILVPAACIAERILPVALRNWFFLASDCEEVRLGFNPTLGSGDASKLRQSPAAGGR